MTDKELAIKEGEIAQWVNEYAKGIRRLNLELLNKIQARVNHSCIQWGLNFDPGLTMHHWSFSLPSLKEGREAQKTWIIKYLDRDLYNGLDIYVSDRPLAVALQPYRVNPNEYLWQYIVASNKPNLPLHIIKAGMDIHNQAGGLYNDYIIFGPLPAPIVQRVIALRDELHIREEWVKLTHYLPKREN